MKNIALKRIYLSLHFKQIPTLKTCTRILLVNCFMQPVKNYWLVISNLLQMLEPKVFFNHVNL